jgi:hypothetical protein
LFFFSLIVVALVVPKKHNCALCAFFLGPFQTRAEFSGKIGAFRGFSADFRDFRTGIAHFFTKIAHFCIEIAHFPTKIARFLRIFGHDSRIFGADPPMKDGNFSARREGEKTVPGLEGFAANRQKSIVDFARSRIGKDGIRLWERGFRPF